MENVMGGNTENDNLYQATKQKSEACSDKLDALQLPKETKLFINWYVSENATNGSHYGELAY